MIYGYHQHATCMTSAPDTTTNTKKKMKNKQKKHLSRPDTNYALSWSRPNILTLYISTATYYIIYIVVYNNAV